MTLGAPGMGVLTPHPRLARAAESGDIDQCANGGVGKPDLQCTGSNWQNGNLNGNQAHYNEGDSVPYRMKFGGLTPLSTNTVTIGWDILQGDKHALDYLTSYFRTETDAVPCSDVPLCGVTSTTLQIPPDPNAAPGKQIGGVFTLFDGELKSASTYTRDGDKALISLTFVARTATPVLAWGGHIATRADWGAGNSAVAINGSPYHMRLIALNGKGGNQDRSLSNDAVIFPASITVIKDASPNGSQAFGFTAVGLLPSPFSLTDDGSTSDRKVFGSITDFGSTRTVTEDVVPGWTLTALACTHSNPDTAPTITPNLGGRTVSIKPAEGDDVTCTYTNVKSAAISLLKTADPK
ncbi:MAG: hypothetical protein LC792_00630, partial [Actinobacteria bacterium]|nr:hypothetical protein [Actinomycetota bacterium]